MKSTIKQFAIAACMASAIATSAAAETAQQQFQRASDDYLDKVYFPYQPTGGTLSGYHQYDTQLEDFSPKTIAAEVAALKSFEARIAAIPAAGLDQVSRGDRELVLGTIRSELLTLETIRPLEKNPDTYSSSISGSIFSLMERKFASPDERLRSVIAREKLALGRLDEAHTNLKNPPRIYTEIAIEQLPGIVSFFQDDVPQAFADAKDAALKAEFAKSNGAVIAALNSYQNWLKTDVLPHSQGDFRIGADTFQKKLAYDEMVDIPLDKLLEIGWADLKKNQQHFNTLAKELEPNKDPREVLEELGSNHPVPGKLLDAFRATFDSLIGFIRTNHIVTIPSDIRPIVEETPPFMRATTFASMDTPGPFEAHATEAYFNVTLPDPGMTPTQVESFMHAFNIGTVISTAVHEAYPGHYIQFLWVPQAPSRVRKLLGASSNAEGWAHYCEQMMLDQGYGQPGTGAKDEREAKFLRLGQLQDALLRNARFIVGIQMHTGKMSFDEAVEFFQKEGYQSKESALVETKRGTCDATYLYYTLGKLEILKLREDMKKKQGSAFSLEEFHNNFLRQGFPPIKIVREAMLGDGSPVL
ncbi:DUF885 domain-containing protein [Terracidiphilus gabretensis]|uniref:DUF885 domain-containing protein n=1 Tax=Terracidiphilus gabretensis TaxID=1577687 RepID=UPI00071BE096|nr:DUF885 domain-containing protein [Terracidiphilus gabretensis]